MLPSFWQFVMFDGHQSLTKVDLGHYNLKKCQVKRFKRFMVYVILSDDKIFKEKLNMNF